MVIRKVLEIDEEKCNGCGLCISPCVEGAITLENGKAKVISDALCDGAGMCLTSCPVGALHLVEREAPAFDERAASENLKKNRAGARTVCYNCAADDQTRALLAVRYQGEDRWVCVRCLPQLIHG